jgi:hypothetical protein
MAHCLGLMIEALIKSRSSATEGHMSVSKQAIRRVQPPIISLWLYSHNAYMQA